MILYETKFKKNMHEKTLVEAKKRLLRGELVIFPTENVYGIGSKAENEGGIKLIY